MFSLFACIYPYIALSDRMCHIHITQVYPYRDFTSVQNFKSNLTINNGNIVLLIDPYCSGACNLYLNGQRIDSDDTDHSGVVLKLLSTVVYRHLICISQCNINDIIIHVYICNEYGEARVRITQGINRHNPLMI